MLVIINDVFRNIYMLLEWTELLPSFHTVPILSNCEILFGTQNMLLHLFWLVSLKLVSTQSLSKNDCLSDILPWHFLYLQLGNPWTFPGKKIKRMVIH